MPNDRTKTTVHVAGFPRSKVIPFMLPIGWEAEIDPTIPSPESIKVVSCSSVEKAGLGQRRVVICVGITYNVSTDQWRIVPGYCTKDVTLCGKTVLSGRGIDICYDDKHPRGVITIL